MLHHMNDLVKTNLSRDLRCNIKSLLPHLNSGQFSLESGLSPGPAIVSLGGAESDVTELHEGSLHAVVGALVGDQTVRHKGERA